MLRWNTSIRKAWKETKQNKTKQNKTKQNGQCQKRMWTGTCTILRVRIQSCSVTLENSLAVSCKAKYTLTIWPSHPTLGFLPYRNENLNPHKKTVNDFSAVVYW